MPIFAAAQSVELNAENADDGLRADLESAALTLSLSKEGDPNPQDYVASARADYRRLLTALYANGYYAGTISIRLDGREAANIPPLDAPARINAVTITIDPGPAFTFGAARVAPLPDGTELPDAFATDLPARSNAIRAAVTTGVDAWREEGHAKARPDTQNISARHAQGLLDVKVALDPGPRLTFGALGINGNQAVRTSAVRRIAGLPEGAVFDPREIDKAERRLRQSGAFDSVAMTEAETVGPGNTLPVTLQLAETKPRRFGFGLELSSVEGLTASTFWMHRNAFGGAERFRVDGEISGIGGETGGTDYKISTSLAIPAIYGPDTDFLATASLAHEDEPDYVIDSASVLASATRILRDDLTADIGVGLLFARETRDGTTREYTLLTFPVGIEWDRRDSETNAKDGFYVAAGATPFVGLRGIEDGARLNLDARAYRSFGTDDRFTLAARTQIGGLLGASAATAPADFLYYSGGGGTVRGQGYKSLGATGQVADVDGGLSFFGAQVEARAGVTDSIDLVGFYDFGYVGADTTPLQDGAWHAGTGLGVRYNTGIGPIRLDIGTPANGDDAFGSVQVYIGIGQAF